MLQNDHQWVNCPEPTSFLQMTFLINPPVWKRRKVTVNYLWSLNWIVLLAEKFEFWN